MNKWLRWSIAWIGTLMAFFGLAVNTSLAMCIPLTFLILGAHYIAFDSDGFGSHLFLCMQAVLASLLLWIVFLYGLFEGIPT